MESKSDTTTLKVRPMRRKFDTGLANLRGWHEDGIAKNLRARCAYDPATKTWEMTIETRNLDSLVSTWGSIREALERWSVEPA